MNLVSSIVSFVSGFLVHRAMVIKANKDVEWWEENDLDYIANQLFCAVAQPETVWWDDLTPTAQEDWRRGARELLKMGFVNVPRFR